MEIKHASACSKDGLIERAQRVDSTLERNILERAYAALARAVATSLLNGEAVKIKGVGILAPVRRAAKSCNKFRVGDDGKREYEKMMVPARTGIKFKPSKTLTDSLRSM